MIPVHRPRVRLWIGCALAGWALAGAVRAQQSSEEESGLNLPKGVDITWQGTLTQTENGGVITGEVTLKYKESLIQADRLEIRDRRFIEADGNVLIVWGRNRVFGSRMTYDLDEERGVIENAVGFALDEYILWAKSIEKIGEKTLRMKRGVITTCNQPTPYWSFAVSSATVTLEGYARMRNVRLRILKAPVFYLPYMLWPVKDDRAIGLLMPEIASTSQRGEVYSLPLDGDGDRGLQQVRGRGG